MTRRASVVAAAPPSDQAITEVVFQPVEEIKKELYVVPTAPGLSIARQKYDDDCEAAINEQINSFHNTCAVSSIYYGMNPLVFLCCFSFSVEYNNSYIYHALFAYFDRDNVALKGLAK
ncbi:hypothetical protein B296_00052740 [Ensete ventricosum]|uniref:Uncharacterized protein n=1 Tax=Ensete ventricosum TaxID=4639 RepID=A0A426WZK6_ENSVE|nr:hypothetical protein B296_00052740 [Ensete ventricosum]